MTSVSVRFEEMTASHRFELQSETKDDHQQSRKIEANHVSLVAVVGSREGFYFNSLNLKKLLLLKK